MFGTHVPTIGIGGRLAEQGTDASWLDEELREKAGDYIRGHQRRLPFVVLAREGRTWGVYRPFQQLRLDLIEGQIWLLWIQYAMYVAMVPFAIGGRCRVASPAPAALADARPDRHGRDHGLDHVWELAVSRTCSTSRSCCSPRSASMPASGTRPGGCARRSVVPPPPPESTASVTPDPVASTL